VATLARCPKCGFVFKTHAQLCWRKVPSTAARKDIRSFEIDVKKKGNDRMFKEVLAIVRGYGMDRIFSPHDIATTLGVDYATNHDKIRVCLHYLVCLGEISNKRFDTGERKTSRGHKYQRSSGVLCNSMGKDAKEFFKCMSNFSVVE
jgi:uncharacterized C2H2 Zn-finger protein